MKRKIIAIITAITLQMSLFIGMSPSTAKASDDNFINEIKSQLQDLSSKKAIKNDNKVVDNEETVTIMVELEGQAAVNKVSGEYTSESAAVEEDVKASQEDIISEVEKITGTTVDKSFGYLVNGFTIKGKRGLINEILKIDGVVSASEAPNLKYDMNASKEICNVLSAWNDYGFKGEGMVVSVIDTGVDPTHKDFNITDDSKVKLTEDEVNDIISTKLEGRGKYFSEKVPFGYNYAEFDTNTKNYASEHGMHVAGIIGANGSDEEVSNLEAIKGVAPEAQVLAMKIADSDSGALTGDIILAIEDSVKLKADVINMSFGSDGGCTSPENMYYKVLEKAADEGTVCVKSAGNAQTFDTDSALGEPMNKYNLRDDNIIDEASPTTLVVASMENTKVYSDGLLKVTNSSGDEYNVPCNFDDNIDASLLSGNNRIYYYGVNGFDDNVSFKNKVIITSELDWNYNDVIKKAEKEKAKALIVCYYFEGAESYKEGKFNIPTLIANNDGGQKIINDIKKNKTKFNLNLSKAKVLVQSATNGKMSSFTSWGAGSDLEIKPEITAPGGNIYSTVNDNKYDTYSGTSMACPYTAGAEALLLQSFTSKNFNVDGREKVLLAKTILMNTAEPMTDENGIIVSPRCQGAGLLKIDKAIKNTVTVKNAENDNATLALKNIGNTKEFKLKLKNYSNKDVEYTVNEQKLYTEYNDKKSFVHEKEIDGAKITFDTNKVTVKANSEVYLTGKVQINEGSIKEDNFVEGFVKLDSNDDENPSLSVPLLAFYGDYSKESILDVPSYLKNSLKLDYTSIADEETLENLGYECDLKGNYKINPNNIAFSPNGDSNRDSVSIVGHFIRKAKEYYMQILDSDKNIIEMPYGKDYTGKGMAYGRIFDGKVYNSKTGEKELLPEGQYYVRLITKGFAEGEYQNQNIDIPIKIDLTSPEININSIYKTDCDEEGCETYNIDFYSQDVSGINIQSLVSFNKDSNNVIESTTSKIGNGHYIASFIAKKNSINANEISLAVSDCAGNMAVATTEFKASSKSAVIHNIEDNMSINNVIKDYYFTGTVRYDVDKLYINDEIVPISNNAFREKLKYNEGENTYIIKAVSKNNKVVYNKKFTVNVDTIAPKVLSITSDNSNIKIDNDDKSIMADKNTDKFKISVKFNKVLFLDKITAHSNLTNSDTDYEPISHDANNNIYTYEINSNEDYLYFNVTDFSDNQAAEDNQYVIYRDSAYVVFEKAFGADKTSVTYANQKDDKANIKINIVNKDIDLSNVKIFVNNAEYTQPIEDRIVNYTYSLKEGSQDIKIVVKNGEEEIYNKKISVFYDKEAPQVTFSDDVNKILSDVKANGKVYIGKDKALDKFNIAGTVTDNNFDYHFFINNNFIVKTDIGGLKDAMKEDKDPLERSFSKDIELGTGDNYISLSGYDSLFNMLDKTIKIHNGPVILDKPEYEKVDNGYIIKAENEDLDYIEVSTDGINYEKYEKDTVLSNDKNIYARAVSYTGHASEVLKIVNEENKKDEDNKEDEKPKADVDNNNQATDSNEESKLTNTGDRGYGVYVTFVILGLMVIAFMSIRYKKSNNK